MMNYCQPLFALPAFRCLRFAALLVFIILGFLTTASGTEEILQPDRLEDEYEPSNPEGDIDASFAEILQPGRWEGEYEPANLGDYIDASFCVQRDNLSTPPWTVTMRLDLPPPGNDSVEFEILDLGDETFKFRIDLLKALRECLLDRKDEYGLTFKCRFVDSDNENTERLTMERVKPRPDDECQPEIDIE